MSDAASSTEASLADRIRNFVGQRYILPARSAGRTEVLIRGGDVHREMGLASRMPAVCSALGQKFQEQYGLKLLERRGPPQGANVFFRFQLAEPSGTLSWPAPHRVAEPQRERPQYQQRCTASTSEGSVYLVSCVGAKRPTATAAKDLYISDWFVKARRHVERTGCPWFILSAEHGLVPPDEVIAPYEKTLNTMSAGERRRWARRVIGQMAELMPAAKHIVFLAGARYREGLTEYLQQRGVVVDVPMQGLRIGEQISWLGRS